MPAREPRPPDEKPQIERFREAAREFGCDDDEGAFWDKVVWVAKDKPEGEHTKPKSDEKDRAMSQYEYARLLGCVTALHEVMVSLLKNIPPGARGKVLPDLQKAIKDSTGTEIGEYRAGFEEASDHIRKAIDR